MKFLSEFDISEKTIEILENILIEEDKETIKNHADRIYSSILYLRKIGINEEQIEKILIEEYEIFMLGKENLAKAVSKVNQQLLVNSLNKNIGYRHYLKDII